MKGAKGRAAEGFEDLHVYQRARELTNAIYRLTRAGDFARDFGLVDQIRRAAVSVMSNIAEGFERGSTKELIQYLFIAKGSCGEVRCDCCCLPAGKVSPYGPAFLLTQKGRRRPFDVATYI